MSKAQELAAAFRTVKSGNKYTVSLRDDAPEWVREAVHAANGPLHSNWVNMQCANAARDIAALAPDEDINVAVARKVELRNDSNMFYLTRWLHEVPGAPQACDEAQLGTGVESTMVDTLKAGQYRMIENIYRTLAAATQEQEA